MLVVCCQAKSMDMMSEGVSITAQSDCWAPCCLLRLRPYV